MPSRRPSGRWNPWTGTTGSGTGGCARTPCAASSRSRRRSWRSSWPPPRLWTAPALPNARPCSGTWPRSCKPRCAKNRGRGWSPTSKCSRRPRAWRCAPVRGSTWTRACSPSCAKPSRPAGRSSSAISPNLTRRRSRQQVRPLGLLYGNRAFLVGWTDWAEEPRLWRLANVGEARITGEAFERAPAFDLQRYAERSFGVFSGEARQGGAALRCQGGAGRLGVPVPSGPERRGERRRLADGALRGRRPRRDVLAPVHVGA